MPHPEGFYICGFLCKSVVLVAVVCRIHLKYIYWICVHLDFLGSRLLILVPIRKLLSSGKWQRVENGELCAVLFWKNPAVSVAVCPFMGSSIYLMLASRGQGLHDHPYRQLFIERNRDLARCLLGTGQKENRLYTAFSEE